MLELFNGAKKTKNIQNLGILITYLYKKYNNFGEVHITFE